MRLAIVGSHKFTDDLFIPRARRLIIRHLDRYDIEAVISGGAPGIDTLAEDLAGERGIQPIIHLPGGRSWYWYKKRNILIAEDCTHLLCIRSRTSKTHGSAWTADYAASLGRKVRRKTL